jgi:cell division transport system permease protein
LSHHVQAILNSFNLLLKKPLMTLMTVLVISITLVLPALFWVLVDNMNQLTMKWQQGGHISLYLKSSLTAAQESDFLQQVQKTVGVADASLTSSIEGLAELQQQEGMQDIMGYLPDNPLPAVIDVIPAINNVNPQQLEALYLALKVFPQVEQAKLDLQWVNRLQAILGLMSTMAYGLIILLAMAVVLIIGNTLRFAIYHRHEEIQVLKLIGAKDSFILRPFLYSGVWYGLAGAVLAVLLLNIFILSLTIVINQLAAAYDMHYSLIGLSIRQMALLLMVAIMLGWLSACFSVRRQLSAIEPI